MTDAPFYLDIAEGPDTARSSWLRADDGVRLRLTVWPNGQKGTVLLFNGRTEYAEKYGRAAVDFAARGFALATLDWRGQGLSDRLIRNPNSGYVRRITDYQKDVAAFVAEADAQGLPKPYFLVAHSMGGAIGFRALSEGLNVNAAVFSAPMFRMAMSTATRPVARILSEVSRLAGFSQWITPGTNKTSYVGDAEFKGNSLTKDPDMFRYMQNQIAKHPELGLGGPSLHWLNEAMREANRFERMPSPNIPTLAFLGTDEQIVDSDAIKNRMQNWPSARLEMLPGAEHEVMMETPERRQKFFDETAAFFEQHL